MKALGEQKRWILVDPRIDALLDGHLDFGSFPQVDCELLIGRFSAGHLVTVSRRFTKAKPDVERLANADEVWALCPRRPPPGWRILGRFAAPGCFIGLRAWDKNRLAAHYVQAAAEVIEDWRELFGQMPPLRSEDLGSYLGGVFRDVDQGG